MIQELPHRHCDVQASTIVTEQMPKKADYQVLADTFKLLDDPTRLQLFWTLCHTEDCVINLASLLDISSPALSHHLKLLKAGSIITCRRVGKEVYYKAADTREVQTLHRAVEQIMQVTCPRQQAALCREDAAVLAQLSDSEQTFYHVHAYLLEHLGERITIQELSHRFLMNATTLQNGFKALYGTSIATHIKEHRLERAAELLTHSAMSIAEIARTVGYTNASKFSSAFFARYQALPLDYRKKTMAL